MKDYKNYALEVVYSEGYPVKAMLIAALNHMSQEDVLDMLAENDLLPEEEAKEKNT